MFGHPKELKFTKKLNTAFKSEGLISTDAQRHQELLKTQSTIQQNMTSISNNKAQAVFVSSRSISNNILLMEE